MSIIISIKSQSHLAISLQNYLQYTFWMLAVRMRDFQPLWLFKFNNHFLAQCLTQWTLSTLEVVVWKTQKLIFLTTKFGTRDDLEEHLWESVQCMEDSHPGVIPFVFDDNIGCWAQLPHVSSESDAAHLLFRSGAHRNLQWGQVSQVWSAVDLETVCEGGGSISLVVVRGTLDRPKSCWIVRVRGDRWSGWRQNDCEPHTPSCAVFCSQTSDWAVGRSEKPLGIAGFHFLNLVFAVLERV